MSEEDLVLVPSDVCAHCKKRPIQAPHPCPYAADIDGDSETLCTCCEKCEEQCADDI